MYGWTYLADLQNHHKSGEILTSTMRVLWVCIGINEQNLITIKTLGHTVRSGITSSCNYGPVTPMTKIQLHCFIIDLFRHTKTPKLQVDQYGGWKHSGLLEVGMGKPSPSVFVFLEVWVHVPQNPAAIMQTPLPHSIDPEVPEMSSSRIHCRALPNPSILTV